VLLDNVPVKVWVNGPNSSPQQIRWTRAGPEAAWEPLKVEDVMISTGSLVAQGSCRLEMSWDTIWTGEAELTAFTDRLPGGASCLATGENLGAAFSITRAPSEPGWYTVVVDTTDEVRFPDYSQHDKNWSALARLSVHSFEVIGGFYLNESFRKIPHTVWVQDDRQIYVKVFIESSESVLAATVDYAESDQVIDTLAIQLMRVGIESDGKGVYLGTIQLTSGPDSPSSLSVVDGSLVTHLSYPDAPSLARSPVRVPLVDIRADVNRNGVVELAVDSEDVDEETWDHTHGAVFLANLDDDDLSCSTQTWATSDDDLASCHDAANDTLDGSTDVDDLAVLQTVPWPTAPDGSTAALSFAVSTSADPTDFVRLFKVSAGSYLPFDPTSDTLSTNDIRQGVELALEGKDIIRDPLVWDGFVDISIEVKESGELVGSDMVRLRVSPVITSHHLLPVEEVYALHLAGDPDSDDFINDLQAATSAVSIPLDPMAEQVDVDQWTQDLFETGYMSMPAAGGDQHVIRVFLRTPGQSCSALGVDDPLRTAGKVVFTKFRGPDVAGVVEYDHNCTLTESLNSFGNLETIPPYTDAGNSYPLGRLLVGGTSGFEPDLEFLEMIEAQGMQPPVLIDTSWLLVGHVDEIFSFVRASTPRGWAVLVNDPLLARQMLQDLVDDDHGTEPMFVGLDWLTPVAGWSGINAQRTVEEVLNNTHIRDASQDAAMMIEIAKNRLKLATGITDSEFISVPFLHYYGDTGLSVAYQPGTVNSLYLTDSVFTAPDPHGPVVVGQDVMKEQLETVLAPLGITVQWIENWNIYHRMLGEVHCGTNALRSVPTVRWWEVE
jgi:protein-arginine deiminase